MAVTASRVDAATTATKLCENTASGSGADSGSLSFGLINVTGTANVFVGPSGVTTANGVQWAPALGPISLELEPGESLYGVVASGTQAVHVLGTGR